MTATELTPAMLCALRLLVKTPGQRARDIGRALGSIGHIRPRPGSTKVAYAAAAVAVLRGLGTRGLAYCTTDNGGRTVWHPTTEGVGRANAPDVTT